VADGPFSLAVSTAFTNKSYGRMPELAPSTPRASCTAPLLFKGAGVEHDDLNVNDIGTPDDAVVIPIAEVRAASCSVMVMN